MLIVKFLTRFALSISLFAALRLSEGRFLREVNLANGCTVGKSHTTRCAGPPSSLRDVGG